MRVTQSMYYKNLYGQNNSQLQTKLFDVNKQIASGLKIQHAHDDVLTFANTMRLDNEITTLGQIRESTESGQKVSNQTDSILNDFTESLSRTKTLMIQAANDTQSATSRNAIAAELRGLESHFKNLANTSINGKFLFAGSATDVKPISEDGTYMGNDQSMNAFLGSGIQQSYSLSGAELFLGEESLVQREVITNIEQYSLSARYPDFTNPNSDENGLKEVIKTEDTIRDLMGAVNDDANTESHFYIRGMKSTGESFSKQISMNDSETVGELLTQIGNAFGNTSSVDLVSVTLDPLGNIMIKDKIKGSSKLDFHMVAAVDYDKTNAGDAANINDSMYGVTAGNIDHLAAGETNFDKIIKGTSTADNDQLYVKKFIQSSYEGTSRISEYISSEFVMSRAVAETILPSSSDTLRIEIKNGDGTVTPYDQVFNTDATTTYGLLKDKIELDGDFTVSINGDTIKLYTTQKGLENGVSINTALTNDNGSAIGAVSVTATTFNSSIPTENNALLYDRTMFSKDGSKLHSSIPQVLKSTNAFAGDSTKISEVADLSQGIPTGSLNGIQLNLEGNNVNGFKYTATIDFRSTENGGSTFSLDGGVTNHSILNASTPRVAVDADDMTYRQLMDVMNMVVTGNVPATDGKTQSTVTAGTGVDEASSFSINGIPVTTTNGGLATESNLIQFGPLAAGESITIGGLTVTDQGAGSTADEVAAFFTNLADSSLAGNETANLQTTAGFLSGFESTTGPNGVDTVTFTSSTTNTDVTDLTVVDNSASIVSNELTHGGPLTAEENGAIYAAAINATTITGIGATYSVTEGLVITNTNGTEATINVTTAGQSGLPIGTTTINASGKSFFSDNEEYDYAIKNSELAGRTSLSYDGKLIFEDFLNSNTKANISMYDANSGNFSSLGKSSILTFNANNALTISDPKTDFFKSLDDIITAVEENKMHPDGTNGNYVRNVGMSNALTMINNLSEHVARSQSQVGANSNALSTSLERTTLLEVSTTVLRSSVIDTDLAEASLMLTQLSLNYEAMLSTVGKVSKLSLVNYL